MKRWEATRECVRNGRISLQSESFEDYPRFVTVRFVKYQRLPWEIWDYTETRLIAAFADDAVSRACLKEIIEAEAKSQGYEIGSD